MKISTDAKHICNKSVQTDDTVQMNEDEVADAPVESVVACSINVNVHDIDNIDNNNDANNEENLQDNVDHVVVVEDEDPKFEIRAT